MTTLTKKIAGALTTLAVLAATPALAYNGDYNWLRVHNNAYAPISGVYISDVNHSYWGNNDLQVWQLQPGYQIRVNNTDRLSGCWADVLVVFSNGLETSTTVDMCTEGDLEVYNYGEVYIY